MGPMPNMIAAPPNIGGTLCSTLQSFADAHYYSAMQQRCQDAKAVEICWGAPKLPNRSQPLVGQSSPYCKDIWGRYCCLRSFFPIVDTCLICEDIARQSCVMMPRWRIFGDFLHHVFSPSHVRAAGFRPAS